MERISSTTTTAADLGGVVQRRPNDGCGMVDSRRVGEPSGAMVASTAGLARVFTSIYTLEMGGRKMAEATSGACAQGTIFGVDRGVDDGSDRGIRPRCLLYRLY